MFEIKMFGKLTQLWCYILYLVTLIIGFHFTHSSIIGFVKALSQLPSHNIIRTILTTAHLSISSSVHQPAFLFTKIYFSSKIEFHIVFGSIFVSKAKKRYENLKRSWCVYMYNVVSTIYHIITTIIIDTSHIILSDRWQKFRNISFFSIHTVCSSDILSVWSHPELPLQLLLVFLYKNCKSSGLPRTLAEPKQFIDRTMTSRLLFFFFLLHLLCIV